MSRPIHRLEALPFRGLDEGEHVLERVSGFPVLEDIPARWNTPVPSHADGPLWFSQEPSKTRETLQRRNTDVIQSRAP